MSNAVTVPCILSEGIYDDLLLGSVLDLTPQTLKAARQSGALRFTRKGKRTLYLGRWVLDWLTSDDLRGEGADPDS